MVQSTSSDAVRSSRFGYGLSILMVSFRRIHRTAIVGGWPAGMFRCTLCGPSESFTRGYERCKGAILEFRSMLGQVLRLRYEFEIVRMVVQLVSVLVVYAHAARNGAAVVLFPYDLRTQSPSVWLGNFDPSALLATSLVPSADTDGADR
jgi:hypothetical protein